MQCAAARFNPNSKLIYYELQLTMVIYISTLFNLAKLHFILMYSVYIVYVYEATAAVPRPIASYS
jgi:hypothetical protein